MKYKSTLKRLKIQKGELKKFEMSYAWNGTVIIEARNQDEATDKLSKMSEDELLNNSEYGLFDVQEIKEE